jgi:hypothetical protein
MSIRVVVHAEGSKETGAITLRPKPGSALTEDQLGAAHILVRRCVIAASGAPQAAIRLLEPLRLRTGRVARGSSLLDGNTLRQLLAWPLRETRPDLAVLLIDADGYPDRRRELGEWTKGAMLQPVIGVAVQEFEAWLVADDAAVGAALRLAFPTPSAPESMAPGEAKKLLEAAIGQQGAGPQQIRRTIAALADLDRVAKRAPAFQHFRTDLAAAVRDLGVG